MTKLSEFHTQLNVQSYKNTILCLVRSGDQDSLEASLDFGASWNRFPLDEATNAEVVRQVDLPKGSYPLVRLALKDDHPTIEIAALKAQVDMMRRVTQSSPCGCGSQPASSTVGEVIPFGPWGKSCLELCSDENGCGWAACIYWCAFRP